MISYPACECSCRVARFQFPISSFQFASSLLRYSNEPSIVTWDIHNRRRGFHASRPAGGTEGRNTGRSSGGGSGGPGRKGYRASAQSPTWTRGPLCSRGGPGVAARRQKAWELPAERCDLYVTIEPCAMCAGAIVQARLRRVIFGTLDSKAGACGSALEVLNHPKVNHRVEVVSGVLAGECAEIVRAFFRRRRKQASGAG